MSQFAGAVLDMLAYEREEDDALGLVAGAPEAWLQDEGIELRNLRTRYGLLSYTMRGTLVIRIERGIRLPEGGLRLLPPFDRAKSTVCVHGVPRSSTGAEIEVRSLPAWWRFDLLPSGRSIDDGIVTAL